MVKYVCPSCSKEFAQKGHYTAHGNRKTPCAKRETIHGGYKVVDLFSGAGGLTYGFNRPE